METPVLPAAITSPFIQYKNIVVSQKIQTWLGNARCKILDVGCGYGDIDALLAKNQYYVVTAIDIDGKKLKTSWQKKRQKNLRFLSADVFHLPFASQQFDAVVSLGHSSVAALPGALPKIKRVLKPQGTIILDYINHFSIYYWPLILFGSNKRKYLSLWQNATARGFNNYTSGKITYHFGIVGLPNFLEKESGLKINKTTYLYSLPAFLHTSKFLRLDNLISQFLGPILSRVILLELSYD